MNNLLYSNYRKISGLNYDIVITNKIAFYFFSRFNISFKGSTTIFFLFYKFFFKNVFFVQFGNSIFKWEIETLSDFRLLRGDFDSTSMKYSPKIGYEGIDLNYIKNLLKKGDVVLDIGANKGFYTLFMSNCIGETGKVFAFEASYSNYKKLQTRVVSKWNLTNVLPFNFILGSSNLNKVQMMKPSMFDDGTGLFAKNKINNNSIFQRRLDTLFEKTNLDSIKLIKIDVEGAEYDVLSGSEKTLNLVQFLLIEVSEISNRRYGYSIDHLYDFLFRLGFRYNYSISIDNYLNAILYTDERKHGNILFSRTPL